MRHFQECLSKKIVVRTDTFQFIPDMFVRITAVVDCPTPGGASGPCAAVPGAAPDSARGARPEPRPRLNKPVQNGPPWCNTFEDIFYSHWRIQGCSWKLPRVDILRNYVQQYAHRNRSKMRR